MKAPELLAELEAAGIHLQAQGERIIVKGALTEHLRQEIKASKLDLLAYLADPWDEQEAGRILSEALQEAEDHALNNGLLPIPQAQSKYEALMAQVDAAEGDMPAWRLAVAALKEAMLEGLSIHDTPQHTRARRVEAGLTRAWWRRFDGKGVTV